MTKEDSRARTHDLEGVGPLYENPALSPDLLGEAEKGNEPILLLTVNDNETAALHAVFGSASEPRRFLRDEYPYEFFGYAERRPIIAYRCQMGSVRSGAALARTIKAIEHHRPAVVIAVGIAFGKKARRKQKLGDVLISDQVQDYESARQNPDGSPTFRGEAVPASAKWIERCTQIRPKGFERHKGLLICGEKLVDNAAFREYLANHFPTSIGGDMESQGVVTACYENKVDWIVVKGVSDWADGTKSNGSAAQKDALQLSAALNAARLVYSAIFQRPAPTENSNAETSNGSSSRLKKPVAEATSRTPDLARTPQLIELHGLAHSMSQRLNTSGAAALGADSAHRGMSAHQALLRWLQDSSAPPVFALLGEYGMGKTVSCQRLYRELLDLRETSAPPEWARQPLYFDLRQLSVFKNLDREKVVPLPPAEVLISDLINHGWSIQPGEPLPTFDDIQAYIAKGALLIIDGLDECLVHLTEAQHPQFVSTILGLIADSGDSARLLLSCRTNFFKTIGDQRNLFTGQHRGKVDSSWYQALILLPLTEAQVSDYLTAVLPELDLQKIRDLLSETHNLGELAQRPMTLKLIGEHIPELEAARQSGERINGAALYGLVTRKWLERDDGKHHLRPEHKLRVMQALAAHLWRSGTRTMPYEALHSWFHMWRHTQPDMRERYAPAVYNQTKLEEDLRTATFVVRQDEDAEHAEGFRFAHSSLAEYFLAKYLADAVVNDMPENWAMSIPSAETFHFVAEILTLEQDRIERGGAQAGDLSDTLNDWRRSYRSEASELLLRYALFTSTKSASGEAPRPILSGFDLKGARLRGLRVGELQGAHPSSPIVMTDVVFTDADLRDSAFYGVNLASSDFSGARVDRAAFQDCSAVESRWIMASVVGAVFRNCNLDSSEWRPLRGAYRSQFVGCFGSGAIGTPTNIPGAPIVIADRTRSIDKSRDGSLAWLHGHSGRVVRVAHSTAANRLLSACADNSVRVWDLITCECLVATGGDPQGSELVSFSPNGTEAAYARDDFSISVWDIEKDELSGVLTGHEGRVSSLTFSSDGYTLISTSLDSSVRVWDVATLTCALVLKGHDASVLRAAISRDRAILVSASSDRSVKLWDAGDGTLRRSLLGHTSRATCVDISPDGRKIASGSDDKSVRVWDAATGRCLLSIRAHSKPLSDLGFSPTGKFLASSSLDGTVCVWNAVTGERIAALDFGSRVSSVTFCDSDDLVAAACDDSSVRLWDLKQKEFVGSLGGQGNWVTSVACSVDGTLLWGSGDRTAHTCRIQNGFHFGVMEAHSDRVTGVAFSPSGLSIATASADHTLRIWTRESDGRSRVLQGHTSRVMAVAFSPDGCSLLSGSVDHTARLWDVSTGSCNKVLDAHRNRVTSVCFVEPSLVITGSYDTMVGVWDVSGEPSMRALAGHPSEVTSVAASRCTAKIASGSSDGTVRVWSLETMQCDRVMTGHTGRVLSVAFSPDGRYIASGSRDRTVCLWDTNSGQVHSILRGHLGGVSSVCFSADGKQVITGSIDESVRVWGASSGRCLFGLWANSTGEVCGRAAWRPAGDDATDGGEVFCAQGDAWRLLGRNIRDDSSAPGVLTRLPI